MIISTAALVLGAHLASAVSASASPLLSGYGGPGQGNQAILGAALVGGSGGGGGSSPSAATSSSASNGTVAPIAAAIGGSRGPASGRAGAGGAGRRSGGGVPRQDPRSRARGPLGVAPATAASERAATASAPALGLSGAKFAYIILTLAALAFTGFFTRRLTRPRPTPAKGHG